MDMIKKIHKIPDKVFFKAVFLIVILWNLKYLFLPVQVPFTILTQDFIWKNPFYSSVFALKKAASDIKSFQDEGEIGFVSDEPQNNVFDIPTSIKNFYIAQYAVIPSILKNDTEHEYEIAFFDRNILLPEGFSIVKKINEKLYILKKENK